jgi:hypothetical protein
VPELRLPKSQNFSPVPQSSSMWSKDQGNPAWTAKATAGEVAVNEVIGFHHGPLRAVAENKTIQVFEGNNLKREDYAHLDIRRTVFSWL